MLFKGFALVMSAMLCVGAAGCFKKSEKQKEKDFINTLGGVSETFDGAVSTQSYPTATEAAQAFVQQEVVAQQSATVVSTKSNGVLTTPAQVDELNLPADIQDSIQSVEKMEVEYAEGQTSYTSTTQGQTKKVTVYVIKYPTDWKYYAPAPITGETISKSYYDSVFDYEKYKNCTYTNTLRVNANVSMVVNVDIVFTQTIKHT